MKHKQTLAMLLAAAMVLSMPLGAYAQGTAEGENSTDSVQPYVVDNKAPVLNSIKLSDETVNAGGTLTVTIDAEDDMTGVADWQATFVNKETKKHLTTYLQKYSDAGMLKTSKYEPSGTYELESVSLEDKAGNIVFYEKNPGGWEPGDNAIIKKLELEVSFTVTNDNQVDTQAPELKDVKVDKDSVKAGETLEVTIGAEDDLTGVADWQATFVNKETKKHLTTYLQKYSDAGMLETSKYEPSGTYELESVSLEDKAGNIVFYEKNPGGWEPGDNAIIKKLELEVSFTVINDDPVTPPTQPEGNKPSRPGSSDGNNSANSSNGSGVVNYESEKPDPADKQAVKAYNFWQDAKSKIRKTAEGKTLRLSVPKEITNLPASVMETLRKENVSLRLNWNGKTITIPAGKAQPKQKLRIYWTMQTLEKLYNA